MSKNILDQNIIVFIVLYTIIVISDLICSSHDSYLYLRYFTKPAILGSLIIFLLVVKKRLNRFTFRIIGLALLFSLAGDVLLLFTHISQLFFMMGLIMFLLAHIMYIVTFLKNRGAYKNRLFLLFTIVYGVGLFYLLYPGLGEMLIPVVIYMVVILLMSNVSYLRSKHVSRTSYILVFAGSLFFMLSDSLLAIDKFYEALPLGNIWIMSTYAIAQFLIVYGVVSQKELQKSTKIEF
ncbi:lysoplasmalogenase [Aquimarina sp. 2304DJ70-9]|uniref:lysoplasmalogenase n=1 Tax=Aquimarina penaris TaxID=3231044 RepID=UPI003461B92E